MVLKIFGGEMISLGGAVRIERVIKDPSLLDRTDATMKPSQEGLNRLRKLPVATSWFRHTTGSYLSPLIPALNSPRLVVSWLVSYTVRVFVSS